uniref:Condensin complex subunit 1 C-terminal domain-containing protein n=1 Tax=Spongospora subterranea TaxID=70186 RepID=A0A0H5QVQ8_9EUKA|eukprot:CRZ05807.1 hypothetical protein [Spongospora subterranea]
MLPVDEITHLIQHDVNCLSQGGADKMQRRQAILRLRSKLTELRVVPRSNNDDGEARDTLITNVLLDPLTSGLQDQSESCRSSSLALLKELIPADCQAIAKLFSKLVLLCHERLTSSTGGEPSEELRLSLIQLLSDVVTSADLSVQIKSHEEVLLKLIGRVLLDQYPDLKSGICAFIQQLATSSAHLDFKTVVPSVLINLKHQRHKVRFDSLVAIGAIIQSCNGESGSRTLPNWVVEDVFPALMPITVDRSQGVRNAVFDHVFTILSTFCIAKGPTLWSLLMMILAGMSDPSAETSSHCLARFAEFTPCFVAASSNSNQQSGPELLCDNLEGLLSSQLLPMLTAWTSSMRLQASRILQTVIVQSSSEITSFVDKVIRCLICAANDDDPANIQSLGECAYLLGSHAQPDPLFQVLYSELSQAVSQCLKHQCSQTVMLIRHVLRGIAEKQRDFDHRFLSKLLSLAADFAANEMQLESPYLSFLETCLTSIPLACVQTQLDFFLALLQVWTVGESIFAENVANHLARISGLSSTSELFSRHFSAGLQQINGEINKNLSDSSLRNLSCLVFHAAPYLTADHIRELIPLLSTIVHATSEDDESQSESNAKHRIIVMDCIKRVIQSTPNIELFLDSVIAVLVSPNIVWRPGRNAAMLRIRAIGCLLASTDRSNLIESCSSTTINGFFPQLVSSLDDYELDIRLLCSRLIRSFLQNQNLHFTLPPNLPSDLLARLDDNNDQVRVDTCKSLAALFSCDQFVKDSATFTSVCSTAFIHLDDPNREIQVAVYSLLKHLQSVDQYAVFRDEIDRFRKRAAPSCTYFNDLLDDPRQT